MIIMSQWFVCETKLENVTDLLISETLGHHFVGSYVVLPVERTCGGVIIACSVDLYIMQDITIGKYMVTVVDGVFWHTKHIHYTLVWI
jgi:hypothetical protein